MIALFTRFYSDVGFLYPSVTLANSSCSNTHAHIWLLTLRMFVLVVKQSCTYGRKMCSCMWVYEVHAGQRRAELLVTPEIKIMRNQHPGGSDIQTQPLCHRLRRFSPTASKSSERFLPGGWKTLLHLTGTSSTRIDLLSVCIRNTMAHMTSLHNSMFEMQCIPRLGTWVHRSG